MIDFGLIRPYNLLPVLHSPVLVSIDMETRKVIGICQEAQDMVKRLRMHQGNLIDGERPSMLAHGWLITRAIENNQHHKENINNVPEGPPDPPAPPDKPANLQNEPPSIKLEGERRSGLSFDETCIRGEADMSGAPMHDEDARKQPKKL